MRALLLLSICAGLSSCGAKDDDIACCAIEPKASCKGALYGLGVADAEADALMRSATCPSEILSHDRIRELDGKWPEECRKAGLASPAAHMDLCSPASEAATEPEQTALPQ